MTPTRKSGGISRVGTRFSPNMENEQADAGRDSRTCLARPHSQARTGTGKLFFFPCSADHEQDLAIDPYFAICVTVHTYLSTKYMFNEDTLCLRH